MKPTQEQVIAWAEEAGVTNELIVLGWGEHWINIPIQLERAFTLAYEAGRKDERDSYETVLVEPPQGENNESD